MAPPPVGPSLGVTTIGGNGTKKTALQLAPLDKRSA